MLFCSGYTKRHLARRLQQSALTDDEVTRIEANLRRAVNDGAGLEEFRAYAKLAAHLVTAERLPAFADWLAERAQGAILTLDKAGGAEWQEMFWANSRLTDPDKARLSRVNWFGPSKFGTPWPELDRVVPAGKSLQTDRANKVRRNAYLMLCAVRRRRVAMSAHRPAAGRNGDSA